MSRWAELFASLSQPNANNAKSAKRSDAESAEAFGINWQSGRANWSGDQAQPKPAEILGFGTGHKPFGAIGTFGTRKEGEGEKLPPRSLPIGNASLPIGAKRSDADDERAAIIEEPANAPRRWAEGYAALCTMPPPAGFSPERWRRVVDATGKFLDHWAREAICCGWSDLDVFGCHQNAPAARFDCMGLVMLLDHSRVVSVDAGGADLVTNSDAHQRFRRRLMPLGTVPLWELPR